MRLAVGCACAGSSPAGAATDPTSLQLPLFRHALLLFGCPEADVEALLQKDLDWKDKLPQVCMHVRVCARACAWPSAWGAALCMGVCAAVCAVGNTLRPRRFITGQCVLQLAAHWCGSLPAHGTPPQDVFNLYLNTSPHMGGLRLRTEDAVPVALSYLITPLLKHGVQRLPQ